MQRNKSDKMAFTASILSITTALNLLAVGCIPTLDDNRPAEGRELGVPTISGLTLNGIGLNGIGLNGIGLNGIGLNGIGLNGIGLSQINIEDITVTGAELTEEQEAGFATLLKYLVQCALPADESLTVYDKHDSATSLHGLLGLAPEWAHAPLSEKGQRLISACLAARTNVNAQTVRISMRAEGLQTSAVERAIYSRHEGAFWGNLFADKPYLKTCQVDGPGISGRICTTGDCGFTNTGHCSEVCAKQDNLDGYYSDCEGTEEVINIFLGITDEVAFGKDHSCFRKDDGTLDCWGKNSHGQLGNGSQDNASSPVPVVALGSDVVEVAGGANHTCARTAAGAVYCWGDNRYGQASSDIETATVLAPEHVAQLGDDVASLAVGNSHNCALRSDGTLWCWGDNFYGQLGNGDTEHQSTPVQVEELGMDVARVSLGDCAEHTCAVTNGGDVHCWGWNDAGQLGDGTIASSAKPVQVTTAMNGDSFSDVTDLCTGWMHTCARKSNGEVWCWGSNDKGRLGDPAIAVDVATRPVQVALSRSVNQGGLTCAMDHTCAVVDNGDVYCWGGNEYGQLGNGGYAAGGQALPSKVHGLTRPAQYVSADSMHTCAMLDDGGLWCWGQGGDGMLFGGSNSATPLQVF